MSYAWKCIKCNKLFDYYQVEFDNKVFCSDKCLAKYRYTNEEYLEIFGEEKEMNE